MKNIIKESLNMYAYYILMKIFNQNKILKKII